MDQPFKHIEIAKLSLEKKLKLWKKGYKNDLDSTYSSINIYAGISHYNNTVAFDLINKRR